MMIRWPGEIAGGVVSSSLVTSTDLYPTILELAGISPRPGQAFDGISIVPALRGKPFPRDTVFTHFPHYMLYGLSPPGTSVRMGSWKLIRFYAEGTGQTDRLELYDLKRDPGEQRDVSERHRAKVGELNGLIDQYLARTSALVPVPNPAYSSEDP
jgi:arylsulfatase A-like enzyme